ncbi:unnamed protein product [Phytophthora lilii]|uniref:Unnamed protein product n=1 Tax=Phytophthora lilii TaxID=2077276 RepID=A0A9W6UC96_9STRA|nr:unnamed protein product [Phytophthora lilii]
METADLLRAEEEDDDAWALELEEELDLEGISCCVDARTEVSRTEGGCWLCVAVSVGAKSPAAAARRSELEEKPAAEDEPQPKRQKTEALARPSVAATLPQEVLALIISFGQVGRVCKSWSLASIAVARRRFSSRLTDILRPLDPSAVAVALDVEAELYAAYGQR